MNAQSVLTTDLHHRDTCRLCSGRNLEMVLRLRPSPIADDYVSKEQSQQAQKLYPLDMYLCKNCGHAQHIYFVDPSLLFRNYNFKTASSPGLLKHFRDYAREVVDFAKCPPGSLVVEIGSNDGSLLKIFQEAQLSVIGIDPATAIAKQACDDGIETIPEFFTTEFADRIRKDRGAASIICANNVYAHIDNMNEVTSGIKKLLAPQGVFVFEVSYLVDTLEGRVFDTIYHEHVCSHSVAPFVPFFRKHGLELVHVERIGSKGGSIRGYVMHAGVREISSSVNALIEAENRMRLQEASTFKDFGAALEEIKAGLHRYLSRLKSEGKIIAGFGASSTVTTLIYHFELGQFLSFLIDDNPQKDGLYSPGLHLPVKHSRALYSEKPDCVLVLAWKYFEPIFARHEVYVKDGGCFIVPLPEPRVLVDGSIRCLADLAED